MTHTLVRLGLAFVVLGPPCMLMGATLPLLVRQFAAPGVGLARSTGWFYAVNTAGAATGCYLTGFHLLPVFGLLRTHMGAVILNLLLGVLAILIGRASLKHETAPRPETPMPSITLQLRLASLAVGAGALMLQMTWMRQLALVLGGTTYAFTAVVLVVLVGIGVGSLLLRLSFRARTDPMRLFTGVTVVLVLGALAGQLALPALARTAGEVRALRADVFYNAGFCAAASAVLELVPSSRRVSSFRYSSTSPVPSTAPRGALSGVCTPGTPWVRRSAPHCRTSCSFHSLAPWARSPWPFLRTSPHRFSCSGPSASRRAERHSSHTSSLGWRYPSCFRARVHGALPRLVHLRAGESAGTPGGEGALPSRGGRVRRARDRAARNPQPARERQGRREHARGRPACSARDRLLAAILRPEAAEILVIGYGSGATVGASLLFPSTKRVDCIEIERGVYEGAEFFSEINHRPDLSPLFHLFIDDGRSHVQGTERTYDLILTEPSNPWMAGVSNLFTSEFYEAARARLNPGGMLGQWIQTYAVSPDEFALVAGTVLDQFQFGALLRLSGGDAMLLASDEPILPPPSDLDRAQEMVDATLPIQMDLEGQIGGADVRSAVLIHLLMGDRELRAWTERYGTDELNTDWNMRLEFDAPRHLFAASSSGDAMARTLVEGTSLEWYRTLFTGLGCGPAQARGVHRLAEILNGWDRRTLASELVQLGLEFAPESGELLADALLFGPPMSDAQFLLAIVQLIDVHRARPIAWQSLLRSVDNTRGPSQCSSPWRSRSAVRQRSGPTSQWPTTRSGVGRMRAWRLEGRSRSIHATLPHSGCWSCSRRMTDRRARPVRGRW